METFISGTLAFLENSGAKRVRVDTEETSSILDKDRRCFSLVYLHELHADIPFFLRFLDFSPVIRINCEFEEQLQRALQNLQ
jgi:hypothetical protein